MAQYVRTSPADTLVDRYRGDAVKACRGFEQAARLWKNADADLPELQTIRTATGNRSVP